MLAKPRIALLRTESDVKVRCSARLTDLIVRSTKDLWEIGHSFRPRKCRLSSEHTLCTGTKLLDGAEKWAYETS